MWRENYQKFGHRIFLVFIELKFSDTGTWVKSPTSDMHLEGDFLVSSGNSATIELIAPDGLRRHLLFDRDAIVSLDHNILMYDPKKCQEITVDEKEQAGHRKTRDILH